MARSALFAMSYTVTSAMVTATMASLGNALLLRTRIATEERALGAPWARAFAETPRQVPGGPRAGA